MSGSSLPGADEIAAEVRAMVERSGFYVSPEEWKGLMILDFGLGDFRREGAAIVDILRSPLVRTTVLVMLPDQTLPEHRHPASENHPGKEETIRVLAGSVKTYQPGAAAAAVRVPEGKEVYYTSRRETVLGPGDQHTLPPNEAHWFQAGPEGVVALEFQNRVDETKNIFSDPDCAGIAIPAAG